MYRGRGQTYRAQPVRVASMLFNKMYFVQVRYAGRAEHVTSNANALSWIANTADAHGVAVTHSDHANAMPYQAGAIPAALSASAL